MTATYGMEESWQSFKKMTALTLNRRNCFMAGAFAMMSQLSRAMRDNNGKSIESLGEEMEKWNREVDQFCEENIAKSGGGNAMSGGQGN